MTKIKPINTMLAIMRTQENSEMRVEIMAMMKMVRHNRPSGVLLGIVVLIESDS